MFGLTRLSFWLFYFIAATSFRAVNYARPVSLPFFSPGKWPATDVTGFMLLVNVFLGHLILSLR